MKKVVITLSNQVQKFQRVLHEESKAGVRAQKRKIGLPGNSKRAYSAIRINKRKKGHKQD
jgi:hypothetical protein